jgi:hypothetical protein
MLLSPVRGQSTGPALHQRGSNRGNVTMTVTNNETIMVETLEEVAFLLEEDPNTPYLLVPSGTVDAMIGARLAELDGASA